MDFLEGSTRDASSRTSSTFVPTGASSRVDIVDGLSRLFTSDYIFAHCGDDFKHAHSILDERSRRDPADVEAVPSQQLVYLCHRYTLRYEKRMAILAKRGGERRAMEDQDRHWAQRLSNFLEKPFAQRINTAFYVLVSFLVLLSAVALILQTIPTYNPQLFPEQKFMWDTVEIAVAGLLLIDWVLRFLSRTFMPHKTMKWYTKARKHLLKPATVLDLAASAIPMALVILNLDGVFTVFSLLRVFRIFFSLRHFDAFEDLEDTLKSSAGALIGPLIMLIVVLVGVSSLVYTMESGSYNPREHAFLVRDEDCEMTAAFILGLTDCPREATKFISILHTCWYSMITFLTVGYGDMTPLTAPGRALGAIAIVVGMLFMAMPIAIVGTNFTLTVDRLRTERLAVGKLMQHGRDLESLRDVVRETKEAMLQPTTPAVALFRFLRVNLRRKHLDLRAVDHEVAYYVDLFVGRAVDLLLNDSSVRLLQALSSRAQERKVPFSARLVLEGVPGVTHSEPLHRPLALSVGVDVACDLCLTHVVQRYLAAARNHAKATVEKGRRKGGKQLQQDVLAAVRSVPTPFVADHHISLTLVGFGGSVDSVAIEAQEPFVSAFVDRVKNTETTSLTRGNGDIILGIATRRADVCTTHVVLSLSFGLPFSALDRTAATVTAPAPGPPLVPATPASEPAAAPAAPPATL